MILNGSVEHFQAFGQFSLNFGLYSRIRKADVAQREPVNPTEQVIPLFLRETQATTFLISRL
jgi:hypothetical protein